MKFSKMHGLGNDFVIIYLENKKHLSLFNSRLIKKISHRNYGIGCDQLIIIYIENNIYNMVIFNSDGSKASACGNAARCVASYIWQHFNKKNISIKVGKQILATKITNNSVAVNMGFVKLLLKDNKLHHANSIKANNLPQELLQPNLNIKGLQYKPYIANIANDHAIFIINSNNTKELATNFGFLVENHKNFPERINVSFINIVNKKNINITTWERGAGLTLACGSAACASFALCYYLGKVDANCNIILNSGSLNMFLKDNQVIMHGSASNVFSGELSQEFLLDV